MFNDNDDDHDVERVETQTSHDSYVLSSHDFRDFTQRFLSRMIIWFDIWKFACSYFESDTQEQFFEVDWKRLR